MGIGRRGGRFQEEGGEWRLRGLLYGNDLVLSAKSEEDLRAMLGDFVVACWRRGLKFNAGKSKVMVLGREVELECEISVNGYV